MKRKVYSSILCSGLLLSGVMTPVFAQSEDSPFVEGIDESSFDEETVVNESQEIDLEVGQNLVYMHRIYNPNSGEHFYTAAEKEKNSLLKAGWRYEGRGWYAPTSSKTPVYRLYNANAGDHHYTSSKEEKDTLVNVGWRYEGIGWYSADNKAVPMYRQYNPNAKAGSHNYTRDKNENDGLVRLGWRGEGIGWYGLNPEGDPNFGYKYSMKDIAGTYVAGGGYNIDNLDQLVINSDGTFRAEFLEYHIADSFTDQTSKKYNDSFACWGVQFASGKIRLLEGTSANTAVYQLYDVKLKYSQYQLITDLIRNGKPMSSNAIGQYFGGGVYNLHDGAIFTFYSKKASGSLPTWIEKGQDQFCAPGEWMIPMTRVK